MTYNSASSGVCSRSQMTQCRRKLSTTCRAFLSESDVVCALCLSSPDLSSLNEDDGKPLLRRRQQISESSFMNKADPCRVSRATAVQQKHLRDSLICDSTSRQFDNHPRRQALSWLLARCIRHRKVCSHGKSASHSRAGVADRRHLWSVQRGDSERSAASLLCPCLVHQLRSIAVP